MEISTIKFVDDNIKREVFLIGQVVCEKSSADAYWEFQPNEIYNLYRQVLEGDYTIYIVFNDSSGWYATYHNLDNLKDKDFTFTLIKLYE